MIPPNQWFDDFQKNVSELLAKTPAADIERTMKAFMTQTFARMDLITREEFDVQAELLARSLKRVSTLESRIEALEQSAQSGSKVDKAE
ncbi:MAG TPA: accessory factor UbiK family protein [Castellaniella sp.]|uniref:accessory factor UbiK family protein n=1 Tax=Castellaniella sp. TaxID=1955812 RepID=UPI002EE3C04C